MKRRRRLTAAERQARDERRAAAWNPEERKHYVYLLRDAGGSPLYVGRSSDPVARLRAHHSHPPSPWADRAVDLSVWGPYKYDDVLRHERDLIRALRPEGNTMFVRISSRDQLKLG